MVTWFVWTSLRLGEALHPGPFRILTWNIGSLRLHLDELLEVVSSEIIDAVLLQEHKVPSQARNKVARELLQNDWVIFWGPTRTCGCGEAILIHRHFSAGILFDCSDILAVAVRGRNGNLIRLAYVYAPVQHHAHDSQDDFFNQLQYWTEMPGLWLAGGGFNFNLEEDVPITSQCLTSSTGTWRRSVTKPWGHNLDGFALPLSFLSTAQVQGLHDWCRTQHCPLVLTLENALDPVQHLSWHRPKVVLGQPCSLECRQMFQQFLSAGDINAAWSFWVRLAFNCDLPSFPYRIASYHTCKNSKKNNDNLMALMRSHRRILADGRNNGWSEDHYAQHEHYTNSISRLLAEGRKEALAEWRQNMTNLGHAARWVRDGLASPATIGSDILTPAERGQEILEEWLPRWTQPADEADRLAGVSLQVQQLSVRYDVHPWSARDPWTPASIVQHCRDSAPGLDGFAFDKFAALDPCFLEMLCELFNAFDRGLPFPEVWAHARLVCLRKPDGGTRPITVLATAYRIWASRTAQILADWTSWFPDELVGGRPHGACAADSANHISAVLADKHATNNFLAGVCLDVSKCFDSISLQGVRLLLDSIGAPAFLYNAVNFWHSLQRHVWFEAKPTGVVIQSHLPRGIPQGDPIAPWCLNLIIATWICNLPPLQTVKLFLDDMITPTSQSKTLFVKCSRFQALRSSSEQTYSIPPAWWETNQDAPPSPDGSPTMQIYHLHAESNWL